MLLGIEQGGLDRFEMTRKERISIAMTPQRKRIDVMAHQRPVARMVVHRELSRRRDANDQVILSGQAEHPRFQTDYWS